MKLEMRSVAMRAFPSRFPVARRGTSLLRSARNGLSKISQPLFRTLQRAGPPRSSGRKLDFARGGRRASLVLFICPIAVLTAGCANAPPEAKSWQFTAVPVDRADLPPIPAGEGPLSEWHTNVSG